MPESTRSRPEFRNIAPAQILGYRLPLAGMVSILHRVSGALLFLALPMVVALFDASVSDRAAHPLSSAIAPPAWRLGVWVLTGALLVHLLAGVRHLWMDMTHRVSRDDARASSWVTLAASALLWLLVGAKLFAVY